MYVVVLYSVIETKVGLPPDSSFICGRNLEARWSVARQNKAPALQNKPALAVRETLAFIVLPAPSRIYSKLKRVVYPVEGPHGSRLSIE